jgi:dienelactone hydrolase
MNSRIPAVILILLLAPACDADGTGTPWDALDTGADPALDTAGDPSPDGAADAMPDPAADVPADTPADTGTDTMPDDGCPHPDPEGGYDPSGGSGGSTGPGGTWDFAASSGSRHVYVYFPSSYAPDVTASPVIYLFNEEIDDWRSIADADGIVLVDLDEYNDVEVYVDKLNAVTTALEAQYNVDRARYYWAGWSAGGNIVVILGAGNQDFLAGTMVFPGTGGDYARTELEARSTAAASDPCLHMMAMFYACGSADPNYDYGVPVEYEANAWRDWFGYDTTFVMVEGSNHYISETTHHIRQQAWDWIEGHNLYN